METNDVRTLLPASAESTRALELADKEFRSDEPEDLLMVYARDAGLTEADRDAVAAAPPRLGPRGLSREDGKALMLVLPFTGEPSLDQVGRGPSSPAG